MRRRRIILSALPAFAGRIARCFYPQCWLGRVVPGMGRGGAFFKGGASEIFEKQMQPCSNIGGEIGSANLEAAYSRAFQRKRRALIFKPRTKGVERFDG